LKKNAYKLEGSVLDVLFNYVAQGQPVPQIVSIKALKQWQAYLTAEGNLSLEESFFGSNEDSYSARSASYKNERKLYMALLNSEIRKSTAQELKEVAATWCDESDSLIDAENMLARYAAWKKLINAGRVLT